MENKKLTAVDKDVKDGKIKITLKTKTGYSSTLEGMISVKQWGKICKIIGYEYGK